MLIEPQLALGFEDRLVRMPRAPTRHCGMPYVNLVCITYWKTWLKQGLKVAPARVNRALPEGDALEIMLPNVVSDDLQVSVDRLISELDKSVRLQVQSIPQRKYVSPIPNLLHRLMSSYHDKSPGKAKVAILFSGGIDSTALCYFADRCSEFSFLFSFRQISDC